MMYPLDGPSTQGSMTATTTPALVKVDTNPLVDRKVVTLQPIDGIIRATLESGKPGFYLYRGGLYSFEISDKQPLYIYTDTGSVSVIFVERA